MNSGKAKELALIAAFIIHEDILNGTVYQTFDRAYELAEEFLEENLINKNWENEELDFDEAIIEFVKLKIRR